MPRVTRTGMIQVNFAISPQTYDLIKQTAGTAKSYGRLVGDALTYYVKAQERDAMKERLDALETRVRHLATVVSTPEASHVARKKQRVPTP